jgi:predicted ArsR family transcriptional regulator
MDGRQRERVLRLVREHDGALDAHELAAQLSLHVSTARFHLDALCGQGVVARTRIAPSGVGRPRTGYTAVRGRLDYQSLAEILALELGDTTEKRRRRAERAGRRRAQRITAGPNSTAARAGSVSDSDNGGPPDRRDSNVGSDIASACHENVLLSG